MLKCAKNPSNRNRELTFIGRILISLNYYSLLFKRMISPLPLLLRMQTFAMLFQPPVMGKLLWTLQLQTLQFGTIQNENYGTVHWHLWIFWCFVPNMVLTGSPLAPDGPFSPGWPASPLGPAAPGGPAGPVEPAGPGGPSLPGEPEWPGGPGLPFKTKFESENYNTAFEFSIKATKESQ